MILYPTFPNARLVEPSRSPSGWNLPPSGLHLNGKVKDFITSFNDLQSMQPMAIKCLKRLELDALIVQQVFGNESRPSRSRHRPMNAKGKSLIGVRSLVVEYLMSEANSQHHGAEVSLMQNALRDRSAILNSEVANLQSTIQSQKI